MRKANEELQLAVVRRLQAKMARIKTQKGVITMCAYCKGVRDDEEHWHPVEAALSKYIVEDFIHGICPECLESRFAELK